MKKDQAEQMKMAGPKSSNGLTSLKSKTARGSIHEKPSKTAGNVSANAKRDADVEEAIIKNTVREKLLQDPELQFENPYICTYKKKLEQLYEYEEKLLNEDKNRKENRRGLKSICRMQGSASQSYFLWDAQENKVARKLFYDLENREPEVVEDNAEEIEAMYFELAAKQQIDVDRIEEDKAIENRNKIAESNHGH